MAGHQLVLPYGYRDAKLAVIVLSMIGEVVQGEERSWSGDAGNGPMPGKRRPLRGHSCRPGSGRRPAPAGSPCLSSHPGPVHETGHPLPAPPCHRRPVFWMERAVSGRSGVLHVGLPRVNGGCLRGLGGRLLAWACGGWAGVAPRAAPLTAGLTCTHAGRS